MRYILKKIFNIILIIITIFALRYILYKYNLINVNYLKYNNRYLNIPVRSDIVINKINNSYKIYFINTSFVSLYNKANISYLLKYLDANIFSFKTDGNIIISFNTKNSTFEKNLGSKNVDKKFWKKLKIEKIYKSDKCEIFKRDIEYQIYLKNKKYSFITITSLKNNINKKAFYNILEQLCYMKGVLPIVTKTTKE